MSAVPSLSSKPRIALTVGDPAGIGPELVLRLLSDPATAARADITRNASDCRQLPDEMKTMGNYTIRPTVCSIAILLRQDSHFAKPAAPAASTGMMAWHRWVSA